MSKEREMIEKLCSSQMTYSDWLLLIADAEELLAQPEPEPVNFDLERMKLAVESPVSDVTVEGLIDKVKSNREHIVDVGNMVEPVAWMYEWYENDLESTQAYCGSEKPFKGEIKQPFNIRPLYIAPPKRKPLTPQQISVGNQSQLNVTRDAFVKGIKYAEEMHGIGGEE